MKDFFGREIEVGDWVLRPDYSGHFLELDVVTEITHDRVKMNTENGHQARGAMMTERLVIVPSELVILRKLER